MMEFVDSLKRGVDRAGFEVDRLLRANRVRARINTLRSQVDEEERQIGHRVLELFRLGESVHPDLAEHCERVKEYQAEIAQRQGELDAINREVSPATGVEQARPVGESTVLCPNCGATPPADALFCPRCGANLKATSQPPEPPSEQPTT